jgi:hypothetical protein
VSRNKTNQNTPLSRLYDYRLHTISNCKCKDAYCEVLQCITYTDLKENIYTRYFITVLRTVYKAGYVERRQRRHCYNDSRIYYYDGEFISYA